MEHKLHMLTVTIRQFKADLMAAIVSSECKGFSHDDLVQWAVEQSNLRGQLGAVQEIESKLQSLQSGEADED